MGLWDKLKGRVQDEIAERAAKAALEKGKAAAKDAVKNAGKAIEDALFGEEPRPEDQPEKKVEPRSEEAEAFFAEQRKKVAEKKRLATEQMEREVDDELAALKKKLGKKK